ncbi:MAG: CD1375 family protein [Bacillota bacterium]
MQLKHYLIVSYAILVKAGKWLLEPVDGDNRPVVPAEYQIAVAEYLVSQA